MKLIEYQFKGTQASPQLDTVAWEGYLEAGKAFGILTRYLPDTDLDKAYKYGWDKRQKEIEDATSSV